MKKTILIVILILIIAGVAAALFYLNRGAGMPSGTGTGTESTSSTGGLPGTTGGTGTAPLVPPTGNFSSSTFPTSTTITIGTSKGSVTVNNFYRNPSLVTPDAETVLIIATNSYNLAYNTTDSSFTIGLLSEPLAAARTAAEAGLLQTLGISQADACRLNVAVYVPGSIDGDHAGINLGLSFCPGAIGL